MKDHGGKTTGGTSDSLLALILQLPQRVLQDDHIPSRGPQRARKFVHQFLDITTEIVGYEHEPSITVGGEGTREILDGGSRANAVGNGRSEKIAREGDETDEDDGQQECTEEGAEPAADDCDAYVFFVESPRLAGKGAHGEVADSDKC